jgi:hypothetical protein
MGAGKNPKPIWRILNNKNSIFKKNYGYKNISQTSIKTITDLNKETQMYDITVEDNHNFILASSGTIVHNCDDFARLGFYYFGHNINFKGEPYMFQGLWAYVTPEFGHMVAVYQGINNGEYFVVSNGETFHTFNEIFYPNTKFIGKFKIINNKLKFSEMVIV